MTDSHGTDPACQLEDIRRALAPLGPTATPQDRMDRIGAISDMAQTAMPMMLAEIDRLAARVADLETGDPIQLALCGTSGGPFSAADVEGIAAFAVALTRKQYERKAVPTPAPACAGQTKRATP